MAKIALGIEYDGSRFSGWQRQDHVLCVQQSIEEAIAKIAQHKISITCAGRTDAGVHATYQVVHFESPVDRPMRAWTMGINSNVPKSIAVRWGKEVPNEFDARFSATARKYRYIIYNHALRPGILNGGLTHEYNQINAEWMHQAAQALVGEHDFTSFRAAHCQSNTPVRCVHHIKVVRMGAYVVVEVKANAFLHHMVRNFVGSLITVGRGLEPVEWIQQLLAMKDRAKASMTAKPNGLYLVDVDYPAEYELPKSSQGPLFLPDELQKELG